MSELNDYNYKETVIVFIYIKAIVYQIMFILIITRTQHCRYKSLVIINITYLLDYRLNMGLD